eukprot:scaffold265558_cov33-Prasinocladus_malaysianus.AAC.1
MARFLFILLCTLGTAAACSVLAPWEPTSVESQYAAASVVVEGPAADFYFCEYGGDITPGGRGRAVADATEPPATPPCFGD